jgi:hypothetical protein
MVPKPISNAVEAMWFGSRVTPPETLSDTLILANDLAQIASPLDSRPEETIAKEAASIDFPVGDGTLADILKESAEEVHSLTVALLS